MSVISPGICKESRAVRENQRNKIFSSKPHCNKRKEASAIITQGAPSDMQMTYLDVLLQLRLMLAGQLLVLPLELGNEDLPLDLLLLLQL